MDNSWAIGEIIILIWVILFFSAGIFFGIKLFKWNKNDIGKSRVDGKLKKIK